MHFEAPHWLVLLLFLPLLSALLPQARIALPLRLLTVLILIVALANPVLELGQGGVHLWVLVDRSASAQNVISQRLPEWERLLRQGASSKDQVTFVDYADVAAVRGESDAAHFQKQLEQSRLGLALELVQSRLDGEKHNRIFVLSDGYSTDQISAAGPALREAEVVLEYRRFDVQDPAEVRVVELRGPARVRPGERFVLEGRVRGPLGAQIPYKVLKDGQEVAAAELELATAGALVRFADALPVGAGAVRYELVLQPERDGFIGNNRASIWLETGTSEKVLLVSAERQDPLVRLLRAQKIEVLEVQQPAQLTPALLSSAQAVIINNVPAQRIPREFLNALDFFVRAQGGGFAMIGGKQSFGAGGYYQSPVDALLPVSMELRDEKRRAPAALVMVLDRSGSMGVSVAGNMGSMSKMDLANEGAARSINLMGPSDEVAVLAVDSSAHSIVPLQRIGSAPRRLEQAARSISSGGGGIYVYEGLKAAWTELKKSSAKTRHIILFSDASDSEEPGAYQSLLKELQAADVTLSVIGLGTEGDPDAPLLKDIAQRGNGRMFFVDNALDLPAVFAQETVTVARSSFEKEAVGISVQPAWRDFLRQGTLSAPTKVDGFNLNYIRESASTAWTAQHEYQSPLFAFWRRGVGKVAALSFPVSGEYSESIRTWPELASFGELLVSYLRRTSLPPGLLLRSRATSLGIEIELHYRASGPGSWSAALAEHSARLLVQNASEQEPRELKWSRSKPGLLQALIPADIAEALRGAVLIGEYSIPFGPIGMATNAEWDFELDQPRALQQLAEYTGGRERADFSALWDFPRPTSRQPLEIALLVLAMLLVLVEVLLTRLGGVPTWSRLLALREYFGGWRATGDTGEAAVSLRARLRQLLRWPSKARRKGRRAGASPLDLSAESARAGGEKAASPTSEQATKDAPERSETFAKAKRRGL